MKTIGTSAPSADAAATNTLLRVAAYFADVPVVEAVKTAHGLLAGTRLPRRGYSTLNNDGDPLQLCLSFTRKGCRVRMIGDPGSTVVDPIARHATARQALAFTLNAGAASSLAPVCETTLRITLPEDREGLSTLSGGGLWLGAALGQPGCAVYTTARWGPIRDRWPRTNHWLTSTLPDTGPASIMLDRLAGSTQVVSTGIEGNTIADARAKLYWRLGGVTDPGMPGIPAFMAEVIATFLSVAAGAEVIRRTGILFSAGFSLSCGAMADIKVDLCAHCLKRSHVQWQRVFESLSRTFGLPAIVLPPGLDMAFVGLGINARGAVRLNVYLKRQTDDRIVTRSA